MLNKVLKAGLAVITVVLISGCSADINTTTDFGGNKNDFRAYPLDVKKPLNDTTNLYSDSEEETTTDVMEE